MKTDNLLLSRCREEVGHVPHGPIVDFEYSIPDSDPRLRSRSVRKDSKDLHLGSDDQAGVIRNVENPASSPFKESE